MKIAIASDHRGFDAKRKLLPMLKRWSQESRVTGKIRSHHELDVYRSTFEAAMVVFELSTHFPIEGTYSLTDQVRRSSRSVCANLAEAWRKRRYQAAFISKLSDAEAEV